MKTSLLVVLCMLSTAICWAQETKIETIQNQEGLVELTVQADVNTLLLTDRKIDDVVFSVFVVDFYSFMNVLNSESVEKK